MKFSVTTLLHCSRDVKADFHNLTILTHRICSNKVCDAESNFPRCQSKGGETAIIPIVQIVYGLGANYEAAREGAERLPEAVDCCSGGAGITSTRQGDEQGEIFFIKDSC